MPTGRGQNRGPTITPRGWAMLYRAMEEIEALPLFLSPPNSWMHAGVQDRERRVFTTFLDQWRSAVRAGTYDFGRALEGGDYYHDRLTEGLLWALVLMQSSPLSGWPQTCMLCLSRVTQSDGGDAQSHESVRLPHRSRHGYWTLNIMSIFPGLRDMDSPRLCSEHAFLFTRALRAMLGFVVPPALGNNPQSTAQWTALLWNIGVALWAVVRRTPIQQRMLVLQRAAALMLARTHMRRQGMECSIPEAIFGRRSSMPIGARLSMDSGV